MCIIQSTVSTGHSSIIQRLHFIFKEGKFNIPLESWPFECGNFWHISKDYTFSDLNIREEFLYLLISFHSWLWNRPERFRITYSNTHLSHCVVDIFFYYLIYAVQLLVNLINFFFSLQLTVHMLEILFYQLDPISA